MCEPGTSYGSIIIDIVVNKVGINFHLQLSAVCRSGLMADVSAILTKTNERRKVLGLGIILILLCGIVCASTLIPHASETTDALNTGNGNVVDQISAKAAGFLLNYTYNATIGLCSEVYGNTGNSLHFNGSVFWIYTDNMLAYYALQDYNKNVSDTIKDTIELYAQKYSLPTDSRGLPTDFKHEPILGDTLPDRVPYGFNLYNLTVTPSYIVATEVDNRSDAPWNNWYDYSDECAWMGMSYLNRGDVTDALACYNNMTRFWDGYGFADAAYYDKTAPQYGYYEPFKLALAVIFRERLDLPKPSREITMEHILAACQGLDGGIATGYDKNLSTRGHIEDTETTALVVIANIGQRVKVGLFYYVWYQGVYGSGHWNGTPPNDPNSLRWKVVDEPVLGFYNSSDPKVIKQHLNWFEELGVDFLIISWWGPNSFEDNATKTIFSVVKEYNYPIQITIMVEAYNWSGIYDFKTIYDYINHTYVVPYPNIYMKLYGLPLVCFWNDNINMTATLANREAIHNVTGFTARIVGQSYYVDWYAWRPCSTDQDSVGYPNIFPKLSMDGFTCIEPRYDDSHIGGTQTFDENYSEGMYDQQWRTVQEYANQGNLSIVAIYSWNEYHERSQIEPNIGPDGQYDLLPFYKTCHYIQIIHTISTIPEFPSLLILPPFMIVTLLAMMVHRRKSHRWRLETE
jgi:hypothetical protein